MRLDEYQWSRNPRGMHNEGVYRYRPERYTQIRSGWVKLVSANDEFVPNIPELLAAGITPIVRIYRARSCGQPADAAAYAAIERYINAGVRWFELWNEPNLGNEWPEALEPGMDPNNIAGYIAPLMNHWMDWAERVAQLGGYPGFIALSPGDSLPFAATVWMRNMMQYLRDAHYDRFRYVQGNGLWCATHPYIYNHFSQEIPGGGPLSARGPSTQTASEGGWHFEYPYDAICQADDPGRTVWGGTPNTPYGDPVGLISMGQAFMELLTEFFGGGVVPVIGTEGGIWPWPGPGDPPRVDDSRYPGYTWESHAEVMTAMFDWIASDEAPPWLFGVTLWKEDDYWANPGGLPPTVRRLESTSPPVKSVPALDSGGTRWPSPLQPTAAPVEQAPEGPGPLQGDPDHHFIFLAPSLDVTWFFQAAAEYWAQFHPILLDDDALIARLPYANSLAVTAITTSAEAEAMNARLRDAWPNIWYDLIVVETLGDLQAVFAQRVANGRRFG